MKEKVDIIFVYWKTDVFIKKCLSQLLKTKFDNYNIYVVDNTRKSEKKIKSYFNSKKVHVILGPKNKGSGYRGSRHHQSGLEEGIKKTDSEYIAICHCDSWPIDPDWLEKCLEYINIDKVKLVGVQNDSSIHSSLHFFRRQTKKDLNYQYNIKKMSFGGVDKPN